MHVCGVTFLNPALYRIHFQPQPIKAGVIVVTFAVQAAAEAGIKVVGVPQPKPRRGFSPNF